MGSAAKAPQGYDPGWVYRRLGPPPGYPGECLRPKTPPRIYPMGACIGAPGCPWGDQPRPPQGYEPWEVASAPRGKVSWPPLGYDPRVVIENCIVATKHGTYTEHIFTHF